MKIPKLLSYKSLALKTFKTETVFHVGKLDSVAKHKFT